MIFFGAAVSGAAPLDQSTPDVLAEARGIVLEMIEDERGPYSRIRWYCNDGTTQPPLAYACRERGGGRQHAEYSAKRQRLASLGWSVGTIYAALTFEELFYSQPRQRRLRELALERYVTDIDNGWVLRRAQEYRGRLQVEDEESSGKESLLRLLSDKNWSLENFLLVREAARVIPHGEDSDRARDVRRAAIELAELEPAAERWRAEIHSNPKATTAKRLRSWLAKQHRSEVIALGEQLANDLDLLYGSAGRRSRVDAMLNGLRKTESGDRWRETVLTALAQPVDRQVHDLCAAVLRARSSIFGKISAAKRLVLVDTMQGLETEVQLAFQQLPADALRTRTQIIDISRSLLDCAYGSGLISEHELRSLSANLDFGDREEISLSEYRSAVLRLKRAPVWALGTIRFTFAEALVAYIALDPRAARFADDVLRGSPMWILGVTLKTLSQDVDHLSGGVVEIAGRRVDTAVALNSGIARGALRIFETIDEVEGADLKPTDVVVLPETIAELSPVAGILTLGEGNALSHVQLLARNFGIPNVAVDRKTVDLLKTLQNREVILVVGSGGNVILQEYDEQAESAFASPAADDEQATAQIEVPLPDLSTTDVLHLQDIGRELSGRVIGPKAANLGELNRLFPARVAPAVAIPFGVYARHLRDARLMERITAAFAGRAAETLSVTEFNTELADVRAQIAAIRLAPDSRAELLQAMATEFGEPETYAVFVRSDTNVEDLPQFTGAGLNETVPNVVGLEAQLVAVPRVWSSVFSPRALAWRSSVLANPAQIYASVLLMKSVPASKSGVLVTANLFDRATPGLTASAAWGVGGAVAGEPAESIVIFADVVELVSESKSPYQRRLASSGGVDWLPADAGSVLQPAEIQQLRELADEVSRKYEPVPDEAGVPRPWDIEFGFVDGELTLFQIRPLVEKTSRNADSLLGRLRPQTSVSVPDSVLVHLDEMPGAETQ